MADVIKQTASLEERRCMTEALREAGTKPPIRLLNASDAAELRARGEVRRWKQMLAEGQ